ncbi:lipopolysaccharide biosynthesis protein [Enterococcus gallinarum]|uniref:lipopolysaccharide biosynthesis protein n=1 Tax=Enterococcus gallinarum TaxID=1353 RepID=UPI0029557D06|nr:hypothetical protein [Enterococcus gallinarum]MDV7785564.1 hypothetical protein [Enterococcus gallinarum]
MNKGRTKLFAINSVYAILNQIIIIGAGFVIPKFMIMYYGSEINGLVSSINQFIAYFNVVEAGLSSATVFVLYKYLYEDDHNMINKVVSTAKKYYFQAGYLFTLLVLLLAIVFSFSVHISSLDHKYIFLLVFLLGARGFLDFFLLAKYRTLLTANQQVYVISIANSIYTILNLLIIVFMSIRQYNIVYIYIFSLVPLLLRSFIMYLYVKRNYTFIDYGLKPDKNLIKARWDALFQQVLGMIQTAGPTIIATIFLTLKDVSIYSVYNMVITGINGVFSIFTSSLSSSFGNVIASGDRLLLKRTYNQFEFVYLQVMAVIFTTTGLMLNPFIYIYTRNITELNYNIPSLAILFVINAFLYNVKTPQGMIIISAGHYKETRWRSAIQGIILVCFACLFVNLWGLQGILIGASISNLYRVIDMLFYVPKYITHSKVYDSLKNISLMFLTSCGTIIILGYYTNNKNYFGWIDWCTTAILCVSIGVLLSVVISYVLNRKNFLEVLKRIMVIFNR